jgi:hypothetical protein
MSKIGALLPSAAVTFDLSYCPQFLQIGSVVDNSSFLGLTITARGQTLIQLTNATQIDTLMKIEMSPLVAGANSTLPKQLMIADGRIEGASTITLNQSSANTSDVFQHSLGFSEARLARRIAVSPVNAEGNNSFAQFDVLFFDPTNFDRAQVTYENGFSEELKADELAAIYAANRPTETNGLVNGNVVIEGYRAANGFKIEEVNLYANNGGNLNVVVCGWTQL